MTESPEALAITNVRQVPGVVWAALCFAAGILLADTVSQPAIVPTSLSLLWLVVAVLFRWRRLRTTAFVCFCVSFVFVGMGRLEICHTESGGSLVRELCSRSAAEVQVEGKVSSIPAVHRKRSSDFAPRLYGPVHQTRFLLHVQKIHSDCHVHSIAALCRVYVQGQVAKSLSDGDVVVIRGRLDWPRSPGNPGEFDFPKFLQRRRIAGLLFVDHAGDIHVVQATSAFSLRRLAGDLRSEAYRILAAGVSPDVRGIAMALLLGSRHELPVEVEQSFVASGTMHLLAISGLHVGILCLFVLQLLHVLMVRRRLALILTLCVCVAYAGITDLRPSVFRAMIFFLVFVAGQLIHRNQRMNALLAVTALLMMAYQPTVVFETGTWLSFLSVAALGWEAVRSSGKDTSGDLPTDALTAGERFWQVMRSARRWLILRYRQMLYILVFTAPLIASTFHVLSPIGLLVNLALIPLTAFALCVGFATLATGLLLPSLAFIPGRLFSILLRCLADTVAGTAAVKGGHFYVADLPDWFLPVYYALLTLAIILRGILLQRICLAVLAIAFSAVLLMPGGTGDSVALTCTVLDVGHGNATVVETSGGEVYLIDAGARNRSERTADIVCSFLWQRGHRHLTGIVISHPDRDHFNGVPGILSRISVSQIIVSKEFRESDRAAVSALTKVIRDREIPMRTVAAGDEISAGPAGMRFFSAPVRI